MENGYLFNNKDNNYQMQNNSMDKSITVTKKQTEINHVETENLKANSDNFQLINGVVPDYEEVDGSQRSKRSTKDQDSEPKFVSSKNSNLSSDLTSELKLSVQTLESSNHSVESYRKSELKNHSDSDHNKKRNRLIVKAVILLCLAGALQGILVNGLINVVISSIEKRFGIRSTETGFIANSYDIASFLCLLPVSYLGGRGTGTKPVWIAGGLVIMGLGSLLFSLPHFTSTSSYQADEQMTLCNVTKQCKEEQETSDNRYKFVFMMAQFLHGAGAAPLYTLGVTYIDENIGASSSAFFLGIFYTMAIVGPAIGYSVGGQFLNIHTDFHDNITVDDPSWVGAWWLGFVICGISALLLACPIALLPAAIPGMKEPSGDQVCRSRINSRNSSFRSSVRLKSIQKKDLDLTAGTGPLPVGKELLSALVILGTNPTFIFVSLAGASEGFLMTGLSTFLPKLIQNQFSLTASQAAINVGAVSVVAGGGGTLLGGIVVKKLGLKVPGLLKMTSVTQSLAIMMAIGLVVGCEPIPTIGLTDNAHEECGCVCDRFDFKPVCGQGGNHQFFNPCFAGCKAKDPGPDGNYYNCTCVPQLQESSHLERVFMSKNSIATPGPCEAECGYLPVFLASFFMTMLITFLANMPTLTATLRCVEPSVRSLALGIQWLVVRLLGTIPGPVAMGKLFDNACKIWEEGCDGTNKHCNIYDNNTISGNILILTAVCKGLTITAFLGGIRFYKLPEAEESTDRSEHKDSS